MTRRALVTGAAGFIGSALCKRLVAEGWEVTGYDALTYAAHRASLSPELDTGALDLVEANICDRAALARIFGEVRPSHVFHLAAESHV
ncbi:MAG: NAD-dependent epimerase/dehydratase family protein, partial [Pseudomonadota bacterium]